MPKPSNIELLTLILRMQSRIMFRLYHGEDVEFWDSKTKEIEKELMREAQAMMLRLDIKFEGTTRTNA